MSNLHSLMERVSNVNAASIDRTCQDPDALLTESQAAQLLGLTPRALQAWRGRGCGPAYIRISCRCLRYRRKDLVAWTDSLLKQAAEA
jgi:hypothetical protein